MRLRTVVLAAVLLGLVASAVPAAPAASAPSTGAGAAAQDDGEACSFPVTRTDATGTSVTVETEPEDVVVLQASAAQVMWEIGAQEKVVGMPVASYTAYLNGSENRTDVTAADGTVERETVVGLDPDLVLAPNVVPNETVEQLRGDGLTVYKAGFGRSIEDIYAKTSLFGRLVGRCAAANQTVDTMRSRVESIRETVAGEPEPRVLYTFYNFTATEGTFVHEVIEAAGGENVVADVGDRGYPRLSDEVVADRDPEWVVVPSDAPLPSREPYTSTTAYERNQTLVVDANYMNQPGPRVVKPMARMARAFHPQAFDAANATATPVTTETTGETGTDLPGFGLPVAILAVLWFAGVALARRAGRF